MSLRGPEKAEAISPRASRVLAVTGMLAVAGAVAGGLVMLTAHALLSLLLAAVSPFDPLIIKLVAGTGAVFGALLGPIIAWTFLRRVPLGRAILEPSVGAAIGGALGFIALIVLPYFGSALETVALCGLVGLLTAAARLRLAYLPNSSPGPVSVRGPTSTTGRAALAGAVAGSAATVLIFGIWGITRIGLEALTTNGSAYVTWGAMGGFWGTMLGPLLSLTLLRGVPLWQAVIVPVAAAILAGLASLILLETEQPTLGQAVGVPIAGAVLFSTFLFWLHRRKLKRTMQ